MKSQLLDGLRAIDLTGPDASDCGRILASFGVEVIHIDLPGTEASLDWRIGQANKLSHIIDYRASEGRSALQELIHGADFLIDSFTPDEAQRYGLLPEALQLQCAHLIHVTISAFGRFGPRRHWRGNELIAAAMSGIASTTGDPDRPPVREPCNAHFFHACAAGALGALIAHHHRRATERGQWVDISAQEMGTNRNTTWLIAHQFDGLAVRRAGANFGATRGIWKVRDGYVAFALMGGKFGSTANQALSDWMDELGYDNPIRDVDWETFMVQDVTDATRSVWIPKLDAFFADRTRAELAVEGRRRGVTATPLAEPAETIDDVQLQARGLYTSTQISESTVLRIPRTFVRTTVDSEGEMYLPEYPGVDGAPARRTVAACTTRASPRTSGSVGRDPVSLPLSGIKVLDFSWAIVGGTTTKYLGDFGAEVIKIESRKRIGLERLSNTSRVCKAGNLDDKPWFAHVNSSKQSLCLNLVDHRSRPIIEKLIRWADVVVENFSPGTMEKLGLSFEAMRAIKPTIILASGSVFGQTGPQRSFWGVDSSGSAASSRMFMTGWPDRSPVLPSAPYGDCLLPCFLAAGLIAALDRRDITGEGCHIDGAMLEVLVQQMLPDIIDQQLQGVKASRRGNRQPGCAPHGIYPCVGHERWIAIAITTDDEWMKLVELLGAPTMLRDARFTSLAGRLEYQDALNAVLADSTCSRDAYELMNLLQASGLAAGVVQYAADTIDRDPQLRARGFLQTVDHPLLGAFEHLASPIWLSETPQRVRPAPRFGEHTHDVCHRIVGLDHHEIDELLREKVLY
jgi:crotonobetainyl-CoA:carnitine CoA-transferase CaiB-like acyl-CoA transferase